MQISNTCNFVPKKISWPKGQAIRCIDNRVKLNTKHDLRDKSRMLNKFLKMFKERERWKANLHFNTSGGGLIELHQHTTGREVCGNRFANHGGGKSTALNYSQHTGLCFEILPISTSTCVALICGHFQMDTSLVWPRLERAEVPRKHYHFGDDLFSPDQQTYNIHYIEVFLFLFD